LRHETDLRSEPFQIQITDVGAIKPHRAGEGVIESFDKRDDGRFARARSTYESWYLACRERKAKVLNNLNVRARRVIEINILEGNFANDFARLKAFFAGRINRRNPIDGCKELRGCSTSMSDSYETKVWARLAQPPKTSTKNRLVPCISGAIIARENDPMRIAMMTLIISPGLARPSLMSVAPKLNAVYWWMRISELVGGQETELTEGIGSVNGKEKTG
jgi:hypothetical protein